MTFFRLTQVKAKVLRKIFTKQLSVKKTKALKKEENAEPCGRAPNRFHREFFTASYDPALCFHTGIFARYSSVLQTCSRICRLHASNLKEPTLTTAVKNASLTVRLPTSAKIRSKPANIARQNFQTMKRVEKVLTSLLSRREKINLVAYFGYENPHFQNGEFFAQQSFKECITQMNNPSNLKLYFKEEKLQIYSEIISNIEKETSLAVELQMPWVVLEIHNKLLKITTRALRNKLSGDDLLQFFRLCKEDEWFLEDNLRYQPMEAKLHLAFNELRKLGRAKFNIGTVSDTFHKMRNKKCVEIIESLPISTSLLQANRRKAGRQQKKRQVKYEDQVLMNLTF